MKNCLQGKLNDGYQWYLTKEEVQHYTINSSFVHNHDDDKNMLPCMKSLLVSCRCMPM